MKVYGRCVVTKTGKITSFLIIERAVRTGIYSSGIPVFCHLCHFSGIVFLKISLFNLRTMLNSIEQDEILNKKFVRLSFVHYLCSVQSN